MLSHRDTINSVGLTNIKPSANVQHAEARAWEGGEQARGRLRGVAQARNWLCGTASE